MELFNLVLNVCVLVQPCHLRKERERERELASPATDWTAVVAMATLGGAIL